MPLTATAVRPWRTMRNGAAPRAGTAVHSKAKSDPRPPVRSEHCNGARGREDGRRRDAEPASACPGSARPARRSALAAVEEGETPLEFGARLAKEVPEAAGPAWRVAERFAVAAYAPPEVAASSREAVLSAWSDLRPALLRRLTRRVRLA